MTNGWLDVGRILGGGLALYFGAEWLVRGASGLALSLGIRPLVIGVTVVAFGTSAPELVVTLVAAVEGNSAIALGNVVGSNVANLGLILALTALVFPPRVDSTLIRREVPVMLGAALLLPALLVDGRVSRLEGGGLLLIALLFTLWSARQVQSPTEDPVTRGHAEEEVKAASAQESRFVLGLLCLLGLSALVLGGKLFVDGASASALRLGISQRVVGLTVVAVGTSLPELATSLVAALRRHSDIAVGNVVGSNIYNVLLILGGASAVAPISGELGALQWDLACMIGLTAVASVFLRGDRLLTRWEGAMLLSSYVGFLALAVAGSG